MTTPIKPNTGGVPPLPLTKEENGKTKDIAGKVSQATGGTGSAEVRTAYVPITTATPSVPDPKTAVAAVKQSVKKEMGLEALLQVAPPVRNMILTGLSEVELDAFDIALSKGTALENTYKETFQAVKKQITQIRNEKLLNEILIDHPSWKIPDTWKEVSLEEKIWLLQLYELNNIGLYIRKLDPLHINQKRPFIPSTAAPELLRPEIKKSISETLLKQKQLLWNGLKLQKCPKAIRLLVNLEKLDLKHNELTVPPDVSRNVKLETLDLTHNKLTTPPDLRWNINLEFLYLGINELTIPPDTKLNVKLQKFYINMNQLTTPPDISCNHKLRVLNLEFNQLTTFPDISQNDNLLTLDITENSLTTEARDTLTKLKSTVSNDLEILF